MNMALFADNAWIDNSVGKLNKLEFILKKNIIRVLEYCAPAIFVVLWSTGFIGAKLGLPHAEPFTFLTVRMLITLAILLPIVIWFAKDKITSQAVLHSMVTGVFVHAVYLGGVFFAIKHGMSAGVSALIVALQPLVTAVIAKQMLGERVSQRQIVGLVAALFGVALVLLPKFTGGNEIGGITLANMVAIGLSVLAISFGTVYQKRYASGVDIRISATAQYIGALIILALLSLVFETRQINWTGEFIFALGWLILVLSIGAVALLMFLIRRDSASSIASLFYLVPVSTAIIAFFLFGESLQPVQLIGMTIVIAALAFGARGRAKTVV